MAAERQEPSGSPLDDSSLPFYTIGQVARMLGVQQAALRRLDEQDIVRPDRSEGGQRRYSQAEVERLREVLELTDEGVTLPGVRRVLALRQQVGDLEEEIAQMRKTGQRPR
jgi:MerR family transcriptional regulator/heat shock protein HspR